MAENEIQPQKITMANTKQEMLKAYNSVLKQLQEKKEAELKPEKKLEEKKKKEVVEIADSISAEGVATGIVNLKVEIGKMLTQISDKLEEQVNKFKGIQKAIEFKENELEEVYEIEKAAASLAALIEAQNQQRLEFDAEMAAKKDELNQQIDTLRAERDQEKKEHDTRAKELAAEEKKKREREKEEFDYTFEREQQLAKDEFKDGKTRLEREMALRKEQMEKELMDRERAVAETESELEELRNKGDAFPEQLQASVNKAIKETTERMKIDEKSREELLEKEFEGQRNVSTAKIESLEKTLREQSEQIARLSQQLEKAYQKVQDIAVKAIEGPASSKSFASLEQLISEQTRRQSQEK